jgi:hypothetical protein
MISVTVVSNLLLEAGIFLVKLTPELTGSHCWDGGDRVLVHYKSMQLLGRTETGKL